VGLPAWVRIPVLPSATSRRFHELLGGVHLGFLVGSPFRIACEFLHWLRAEADAGPGQGEDLATPDIAFLYLFIYFNWLK
jgi:hypothetical protein